MSVPDTSRLLVANPTVSCACGANVTVLPLTLSVVEGRGEGRDSQGRAWQVDSYDLPDGWRDVDGSTGVCPECAKTSPLKLDSSAQVPRTAQVSRASQPRAARASVPTRRAAPRDAIDAHSASEDRQPKHVNMTLPATRSEHHAGIACATMPVLRSAPPQAPVPRETPRDYSRLSPTAPRPKDSRPRASQRLEPASPTPRAREVAQAVVGIPARANRVAPQAAPIVSTSAPAPVGTVVVTGGSTSTRSAGTQAVSAVVSSGSASTVSAKVSFSTPATAPTEAVRPVVAGSRPNAPVEIIRAAAQPTRLVDVEQKVSAANVAEPPKPRPLVESWNSAPVETAIIQKR